MENTPFDSVPEQSRIRQTAIQVHEQGVDYFISEYNASSQNLYSTAFTYGRKKMDEVLNSTIRQLPVGARILDAGCGTGEQIRRSRDWGYDVVGIEPSPSMRHLAQLNNPGCTIEDGVISSLPFADGSFDFVMAIEVLRYLHQKDIEKAYQEMVRVLKPGGKLFFSMVNTYALDGYYPWHQLRAFTRRALGLTPGAHCEFQTPSKIQMSFRKLGQQQVKIDGRMLAPLRFAYKGNVLLGQLISKTLEPLDDFLSKFSWHTPFAGHLIVVVTKTHDTGRQPGPSS